MESQASLPTWLSANLRDRTLETARAFRLGSHVFDDSLPFAAEFWDVCEAVALLRPNPTGVRRRTLGVVGAELELVRFWPAGKQT